MNIPYRWLKDYVEINVTPKELGDKLTMVGQAVELIDYKNEELKSIVTGRIEKLEQHPDADKLVVCQVNTGSDTVQIVTGAKNVKEGDVVPVVLVGGCVAGNHKISKGKLRGVESFGMMCSIEELGFSKKEYPEAAEDGIYIFDKNTELGQNVIDLLMLQDEILEVDLTSNRPDCYSILGIARETSACLDSKFTYPETVCKNEVEEDLNSLLKVEIKDKNCKRYIGRLVKDVKVMESPMWLKNRLIMAGLRPINNFVDITNFVMLEYGQPLHAFDFDTVKNGKIIVRSAVEGEKVVTLDEVERELTSDMMVIADEEKALAIAGVMGLNNSKITDGAKFVLFESASFEGTNIRLTSKKLGLRTDSSGKFEKGLDPNLCEEAINRALYLVELLGAGTVVKGSVDVYENKRVETTVEYDVERVNKFLGTKISSSDMVDYLRRVFIKSDGKVATIPTFRADVESFADVCEEIARVYGYDKIEPTLATGEATVGKYSFEQIIDNKIIELLVSKGLLESYVYSFESPKVFDKLNISADSSLRNCVVINNPLGEDFSIMRTNTANGMLNCLSNNFRRKYESAKLFEMGKVYIPKQVPITELPKEEKYVTIGMYGKDVDFYTVKGIVIDMLSKLGINESKFLPNESQSYTHPGRCADVFVGDEVVGLVSEVHPKVSANYSINSRAYIAQINISALYKFVVLEREFKDLPKFPSSRRDIALLVSDDVLVMQIEDAIKEKGGKILESVKLFDIYTGEKVAAGFKSMAFALEFRGIESTLTDVEINEKMEKVLKNLKEKLNIELRS